MHFLHLNTGIISLPGTLMAEEPLWHSEVNENLPTISTPS